jgi:hypothetical protein
VEGQPPSPKNNISMKKVITLGLVLLATLAISSCQTNKTDPHQGHNHNSHSHFLR